MLHKPSDRKRLTSCGIEIAAFENDRCSLPYPLSRKAAAGWAVIGKDGGVYSRLTRRVAVKARTTISPVSVKTNARSPSATVA